MRLVFVLCLCEKFCVKLMLAHSPIQCKGVVELYMWVSYQVKGRELLQRLHQLHDGLVVLGEKNKGHTDSYTFNPRWLREIVGQFSMCPSQTQQTALAPEGEFLVGFDLLCLRLNSRLNTNVASIIERLLHRFFFFLLVLLKQHGRHTQSVLNNSGSPHYPVLY